MSETLQEYLLLERLKSDEITINFYFNLYKKGLIDIDTFFKESNPVQEIPVYKMKLKDD